ncbi:MAG TPA: hypothetical protein ENI23_06385 [bacterium]|nr:hypothetical protein [bacterium]
MNLDKTLSAGYAYDKVGNWIKTGGCMKKCPKCDSDMKKYSGAGCDNLTCEFRPSIPMWLCWYSSWFVKAGMIIAIYCIVNGAIHLCGRM